MRGKDTVARNPFYHCLEYDHDQKGDLCLVACGVEKCDPGVTYGPDLRECWHLHMIRTGGGTLHAGGKTVHPRKGQLFLLKNGETVSYTADREDPWQYCWVTYTGSMARLYSDRIGFTDGVYCLDCGADPGAFYEIIRRMQQRPEMNEVSDLFRRGLLMEFLALALDGTGYAERRRPRGSEHSPEYYVEKALGFIRYNYASMRVSDLMAYIGFSRSYFTTLFTKQVGISPQEYLLRYRIEQACRLLQETDHPVQEIASQTGFPDPLHFPRSFNKHTGASPTAFRASAQHQTGERDE